MSVWRLCERAELGKVGRQWELEKSRSLSVGRSTESDIQVASMSVENNHAVFEWNSKMVSFTIRDLGSINGTYINNRPTARGSRAVLNHGDVVRFGYEKSQVFRVEERFPSPASPPVKTAVASPRQAASPAASHKDMLPNSVQTSTPPLPPASPSSAGILQHQQHQIVCHAHPQPVVVPPAYIQHQSPIPIVMPQYGYPPSPPVSLHPAPVGHVTIPHAASAFHPISPTHFVQIATPPSTGSSESPPINVEDIESSSDSVSHSKPQRSDGRRAVELSNSPNLSKVSKLYGKPSWWGEEKATEKDNDQEFEFVKPGSQILRDYDRQVRSPSCEDTPSRAQRLSTSEDLRVVAMTNSRECVSPASTWVVDFDANTPSTKKRPSRLDNLERRPRSADPSPNRSPQIKKDLLPVTATSSLKRSSSTRRSPSSSPRRSPVMTRRPQSMTFKKKTEAATSESTASTDQALSRSKTITKKPLYTGPGSSASLPRSKTIVKKTTPQHKASSATSRVRRSSLEKATLSSSEKAAAKQQASVSKKSDVSLNETFVTDPLSSTCSLEESPSQSDASLSSAGLVVEPMTPAGQKAGLKSSSTSKVQQQKVGDGEGEAVGVGNRPNSARKQWTSDQSQVPDGLMLASIEARIRRLSKFAHSCSRQLSCLQRSLGEVPGIVVHNIPPTSPLGGNKGSDQKLPEWRFNKEGDSIFRGMRTVEKWLKDIEATVKSIQIGAQDGGGMASCLDNESIDYQAEFETEHEVEAILMQRQQDSMEEFYSFSDTEETS